MGLEEYRLFLSEGNGLVRVVTNLGTGTSVTLDASQIGTGEFSRYLLAEDRLGNTSTSASSNFRVVDAVVPDPAPTPQPDRDRRRGGGGSLVPQPVLDVAVGRDPVGQDPVPDTGGMEIPPYELIRRKIYTIKNLWNYGPEQLDAYAFALDNKITTIPDIDRANIFGPLIRKEAAKMVSNFLMNVMGREPDPNRDCRYLDMD